MLSGNILCRLGLREVSVFLPSFLRLRIIETRSVVELAYLLSSEKVEAESHIAVVLFRH